MYTKLVRLTKDAETRATQKGKTFISINAAYNVGYGEKQESVFITGQYWGSDGILPYLTKGKQVVLAMDAIRPYHNHKDGKDYTGLYADVLRIELVAGEKQEKPVERTAQQPAQQPAQQAASGLDFDDDIPF